jgi:hypothetical protein
MRHSQMQILSRRVSLPVCTLVAALSALVWLPAHAHEADQEVAPQGGSNDILIIEARDALIIHSNRPETRRIEVEASVFQILEFGVREGSIQYLIIDRNRFFVTFDEGASALIAYDCLGVRFFVLPAHGRGPIQNKQNNLDE